MKTTLILMLVGGLVVFAPAQTDPERKESNKQELQELKQALKDLRKKERELRARIAELEKERGDPLRAPLRRRLDLDLPDFRGGDAEEWRKRMQESMRDWQRRMNQRFRLDFPGFRDLPRGFDDFRGSGRSMKMESGPDGVRVEVREKGKDGEWKTRTFEAESLEELKKKHPDLFKGMDFDFRFDVGPGRGRFLPFDDFGVPDAPTPRLGVHVSQGEGGLVVEDVVADSLADTLGIKDKDVILKVNGVEINEVGDVARGLREADGKVKVTVRRDGKERTLEGKAPRARRLRSTKDL